MTPPHPGGFTACPLTSRKDHRIRPVSGEAALEPPRTQRLTLSHMTRAAVLPPNFRTAEIAEMRREAATRSESLRISAISAVESTAFGPSRPYAMSLPISGGKSR